MFIELEVTVIDPWWLRFEYRGGGLESDLRCKLTFTAANHEEVTVVPLEGYLIGSQVPDYEGLVEARLRRKLIRLRWRILYDRMMNIDKRPLRLGIKGTTSLQGNGVLWQMKYCTVTKARAGVRSRSICELTNACIYNVCKMP